MLTSCEGTLFLSSPTHLTITMHHTCSIASRAGFSSARVNYRYARNTNRCLMRDTSYITGKVFFIDTIQTRAQTDVSYRDAPAALGPTAGHPVLVCMLGSLFWHAWWVSVLVCLLGSLCWYACWGPSVGMPAGIPVLPCLLGSTVIALGVPCNCARGPCVVMPAGVPCNGIGGHCVGMPAGVPCNGIGGPCVGMPARVPCNGIGGPCVGMRLSLICDYLRFILILD